MLETLYPYGVYALDVLERLLWIDSCSSEEAALEVLYDVALFHPVAWVSFQGRTLAAYNVGKAVQS